MFENQHIESTALHWPNTSELRDQLSFPLTLAFQPMAHNHKAASFESKPLLSTTNLDKYRCESCKAFVNKACFIRGQKEYDCSICGRTNVLAGTCQLSINSVQLNEMSYSCETNDNQRTIRSKERLIILALDLTNYPSAKEYLLYSLHLIRQYLQTIQQSGHHLKIIIVAFDDGLHHFFINPHQEEINKIVSSPCDDFAKSSQQEANTNNEQPYNSHDLQVCDIAEQMLDLPKMQNIALKILDHLENIINNHQLRQGNSTAILHLITYLVKNTTQYSGKIFLISGMRQQLHHFKTSLQKYSYDPTLRHKTYINKQSCIPSLLSKYLEVTQMSISFFFHNEEYINLMPFHHIAKVTNGELRHYFLNSNQLKTFFYELHAILTETLSQNTGYETLLKVRYSAGLKLLGVSGQYRATKFVDQIQLNTCYANRKYIFEFTTEGKITSPFIVVQFSVLYTNLKGERHFTVESFCNRISSDRSTILKSLNYNIVNESYIRAITSNLDSNVRNRSLLLLLQDRCKKHLQAIRATFEKEEEKMVYNQQHILKLHHFKHIKPYLVLTFLMMKHFLLSQDQYQVNIHHDLNAQCRSKVNTYQNSINLIWPLMYAINDQGYELIEMRSADLHKEGTIAIFIDRCDQYFIYMVQKDLARKLKVHNSKQVLLKMLEEEPLLHPIVSLMEELQQNREIPYMDVVPVESLTELQVLDYEGAYGFGNYINELISN